MLVAINRLSRCRGVASVVVLGLLSVAARAAEKVEWRVDYDAARKEAAEKSKPIFLDFGTEDCVHCKRMHLTTFRDPGIIKILNERFIPLKVDANREPRLTQMLRIQAYPTFILAGNDGKILGWIEGYMEALRMLEQLQRAAALQTPDWMARDYQEAAKAMSAGEHSRAVALLKNIVQDGKDRPVQAKARESLQEIEMQAAGWLERAKQLDDKGQALEAFGLVTDLLRQYAGTQAAADAGKLLNLLADKPEVRTRRTRRAQEMLLLARDEFKAERYLSCLDQCEILAAAYRDLPEGKEAATLAASIKANPQQMSRVCDAMNERLSKMYMDLADSWLKKGETEQAAACLEKVLKINPSGSTAVNAQARLAQLTARTPGVQTGLQKP
jgi:thioredoxin-related protein